MSRGNSLEKELLLMQMRNDVLVVYRISKVFDTRKKKVGYDWYLNYKTSPRQEERRISKINHWLRCTIIPSDFPELKILDEISSTITLHGRKYKVYIIRFHNLTNYKIIPKYVERKIKYQLKGIG